MTRAAVEASLRAVAAPFGVRHANDAGPSTDGGDSHTTDGSAVELRWGTLFAAFDGRGDDGYVEAIELIYEGYLLHYRTGRLGVVAGDDPQAALLAGDVFYARGLDLIASRRDVPSVALLTRLMSACSCLRSLAAPFADDDALWAYTMAGLAALRAGATMDDAGALFDALDADLATGPPADLPQRAADAMAALGLPDPTLIAAALTLSANADTAAQPR